MSGPTTLPRQVRDLLEMAEIYWQDGAPGAAALRLRMAADALQKVADDRQAALDELLSHADGDRT